MSENWLDDLPELFEGERKKRRKKPARKATEGTENTEEEVDTAQRKRESGTLPPVIWYKIKCPVCGSENVPVYHTARPIRYHKCEDCGHTFKSIEKKQ